MLRTADARSALGGGGSGTRSVVAAVVVTGSTVSAALTILLPTERSLWIPLSTCLFIGAIATSIALSGVYLSPLNAYVSYAGLFALGMTPLLAVPSAVPASARGALASADWAWLLVEDEVFSRALAVSATFLWFIQVPSALRSVVSSRPSRAAVTLAAPRQVPRNQPLARGIGATGTAATIASVLAWYLWCASHLGITFLLASYDQFQLATEGTLTTWIYMVLPVGAAFAATGGSPSQRKLVAICLSAFAVAALPVGLRGEVLAPVLVYWVIRAVQFPFRIRSWWAFALAAALAVGAAIKQVRQTGLGRSTLSDVVASPILGLAEMGGSLRPTVNAVAWHEQWGESPGLSTYWAPFERAISSLLGTGGLPAESDLRLFNVLMMLREGPIGGSVIGEAYYSGGLAFVVGVALVVGLLLSLVEAAPPQPVLTAVGGAMFAALLYMARNSFTPAAALVLLTTIMLIASSILGVYYRHYLVRRRT